MTEQSKPTGLDVLDGIDFDSDSDTDNDSRVIHHPAEPNITIELEYISPHRALQLLGANHYGQRKMTVPIVNRYATDMEDGEWLFAGDPIRLDIEGHLVDGQHRLSAIVESNQGQWMLVVSGVHSNVLRAIDAGRRRTFANQLAMLHKQQTGEDLKSAQQCASVITRLYFWDGGNYGCDNTPRVPNPTAMRTAPSHSQLLAIKDKYESGYGLTIEQAAGVGLSAVRKRPGIYAPTYSLMWVLLSGINKDLRERFFFELTSDDPNVIISSPMNGLKNRMLRKGKNEVWPNYLQLHWLIQCAAAMSKGQESPSYRSLPTVRWDLLANIGDIATDQDEEVF